LGLKLGVRSARANAWPVNSLQHYITYTIKIALLNKKKGKAISVQALKAHRGRRIVHEELISPYPDLLPDVFCLMVRIFILMLVLLYI
jgi:hypothetical protein